MNTKMKKVCPSCKILKTEEEFAASKFHPEGGKCIECMKGAIPLLVRLQSELEVLYVEGRRYRIGKNRHLKKDCREIVKIAVRGGILKRMPCEVCGEIKTVGHHKDYKNPLDVAWLCNSHHGLVHSCPKSRLLIGQFGKNGRNRR